MKSRKGIALLITLSVMAAMLALIAVSMGYLDNARSRASYKSALIESDYLFKSFGDALRVNIGKKPSVDTLKIFYSLPLSFTARSDEFDMTFFCEPESNRIPFAWLAKKNDKRYTRQYEIAQKVFDDIVNRAEVRNPERLESMIIQALSGKDGIKYGIKSRAIQKKDIMTQNELIDILSDYRYAEDDDSVFRIEWDKYFTESEASVPNNTKIDAQFAPSELMSIIMDMDKGYIKEQLSGGDLDKFMKEAGIDKKTYKWLFADKGIADMVCQGRFGYAEHTYIMSFEYRSGNIKGFGFVEAD